MSNNSTQSRRIVFKQSEAEKLSLPNGTIELLWKTGVPAKAPLGVSFESCNRAITVSTNSKGQEQYVIASDEGSTICLLKGSGVVVSVDETGDQLRLVNSELSQFLKLLDKYSEYADKVQGMDDIEAESYAIQIAREMKTVDPPVFNDPDDWWPSITQQMEFGTL